MKKIFLTLFAIIISIIGIKGQAPNWAWALNEGANSYGNGIATDASGNVLVTGRFFGPTNFGSTTLPATGGWDAFVAKYTPTGVLLWVRTIAGTGADFEEGSAITSDKNGNVYVTGSFGTSTLVVGTYTLVNAGYDEFFIIKYDANGNIIWANSAGSASLDYGMGISTDSTGSVYVSGMFDSFIAFGTTTLTSNGGADIFIAKYNSSGNVVWAKSAGSTGNDYYSTIAVNPGGDVAIAGRFQDASIAFGSTVLNNANPGWHEAFVARYDANGNALWAKNPTGSKVDGGEGVAIDGAGNVFITGYFHSPTLSLGSFTLTNAGSTNNDAFVAKYDVNGNVLWAKSIGGVNGESADAVALDQAGNVVITGHFQSPSVTAGSTTLTNTTTGKADIFVAKYDINGNALWAKSAGGPAFEYGYGVTVDVNGDVLMTGSFDNSVTFGSITLSGFGGWNVYVAKLGTTTGIDEKRSSSEINIYPNPFLSHTTIQFGRVLHNAGLILYNSNGQEINKIENVNGESMILQRKNLPAGMYFIKLEEENGPIMLKKLVIADQ